MPLIKSRTAALSACLFSLFASVSLRGDVMSTLSNWDGSSLIYPFGTPNTQTYGELITASPANAVLNSFSFEMKIPTNLTFAGYVYAWDSTQLAATGPQLYASGPMSTTDSTVFQQITFTVPSLALTPGQEYVLFASTSAFGNPVSSTGVWGLTNTMAYGGMVYNNNSTDTSQWTTGGGWSNWGSDLAFQADFGPASATPEPAYFGLLPAAFFGMLIVKRRRKTVAALN